MDFVTVKPEFDKRNEEQFRRAVDDELANTYRKSEDLIIPYGMQLGFNGTGGEQAVLKFDAGAFQIVIDDVTIVSFASGSSFTALQTEVVNARAGEANLLARITTVNTTATNAGTAAATVQSEVSAARGGQASLSAKVTNMDSATASAAGAAATAQSEVTAARQGEASLTAKVTQLSTATSNLDGRVSAYYGVKIAAGTYVASFELMASGGGVPASAARLTAGNIILDAETINFGADTVYEDTKNTFYTVGGLYRYRDRGPFGVSSDLLQWYGLNSVALNSETKTNGIFALGTDGIVYYGGAPLGNGAPQLYVGSETFSTTLFGGSQNVPVSGTVGYGGGASPYTFSWFRTGGDIVASGNPGNTPNISGNPYVLSGTLLQETWQVQIMDNVGTTANATVILQALAEP